MIRAGTGGPEEDMQQAQFLEVITLIVWGEGDLPRVFYDRKKKYIWQQLSLSNTFLNFYFFIFYLLSFPL